MLEIIIRYNHGKQAPCNKFDKIYYKNGFVKNQGLRAGAGMDGAFRIVYGCLLEVIKA